MQKKRADKIGKKTKKDSGKSLKGASAKCEQNAISQPLGVSKKRNNHV